MCGKDISLRKLVRGWVGGAFVNVVLWIECGLKQSPRKNYPFNGANYLCDTEIKLGAQLVCVCH